MSSQMMDDLEFFQPMDHRSRKWGYYLWLLVVLLGLSWTPAVHCELYDTEGPQFTLEPSRSNYFTNVQGLVLQCSAKGSPQPQVQWISQNGQSLQSYSGIRDVFSNGTIHFLPFPVSFYRPDVHDQIIACVSSNSVGKIRSRDVYVRAVINQQYEVHVEDAFAQEGGDSLFKCAIPDSVKDFVSVTSWVKDGSLNIFPHSGTGGRFWMAPSGELLIEEVTRNDSTSTFRCRIVNVLTGETQYSKEGRLQLPPGGSGSKSKPDSPPSITSRLSKLKLKEGEAAVLFCLSEGWPPPSHWWMRSNGAYSGLENLRQTERIRIRKSAVIIENVRVQDSGIYVCWRNNTSGSDRHQIEVVVTGPLTVQVIPPVLTVDIAKSAEFTCWINEEMTRSTGKQITWNKDGVEIRSNNIRISITQSGDKLRIFSVQREDKGIYQCFVKCDSDMAQASAELRLGDAAPQLVYRFIEQTLSPEHGVSVSLKCSAVGNPTPKFIWLLDGFPLPHSERMLIGQYVTLNGDVVSHVNITSTRVEDGGEWECTATNKLGTSSHSARLNVYGPPIVRNMPASMTAVAGKDFVIKCPCGGYPIKTVAWEKDDQTLPLTRRQLVSPNGTLTVKDVDRSMDSGWYSCIATDNKGNSDRKGIQLNVVVSPKIVPFSFQISKEGAKIFATCVVSEGDVPMRLQWLKDNQVVGDTSSLPTDTQGSNKFPSYLSTHRIGDSDALVLQITHVKFEDSGNWSCKAQNSAGIQLYTAQLIVHVPPKIFPFSFPAKVSEGNRVQAVCSVEQGDIEETNLTVTWLKDSEPLLSSRSATNFVKVVHVDVYSAMLIIDRVDSRHNGNYTCRISNSVEQVSQTVPLVVHVPPRWTIEPKDAEFTSDSLIVVPCAAEAYPPATIYWKKAMGNRPENYRDIPMQSISPTGSILGSVTLQHQSVGGMSVISSSEEVFSLANGSLIIRSARKAHQGVYLCEASNGVGADLSKVIRLQINVPVHVHVKEQHQNVSIAVGGKATLRCEINGDGPILEVGWKKGLAELKPEMDLRYQVRRTLNSSQGTFTELTINNVVREDGEVPYMCYAANQQSRSQGSVHLNVQEPPDTPRNLHVISKGSRFIRLAWMLTQDGNSPIIQFTVKYRLLQSGISSEFHEITVPGKVFSETIGNLRPSKKYSFVIVAENQVGQSQPSEKLEIKTDGEQPEGRPKNVRVAAVSSSDISVIWDHPDIETWHSELLLGYYIGYKRVEGEQYQFNTIIERRDGLQEYQYQIKGLHAFSSYEIVVQCYNGVGVGPLSQPVIATTLEDVPATAPDGLHCTPLTSHNLQLSWTSLSLEQARGVVKGYKVFLEKTDFDLLETSELPLVKTTLSTNLIISGLSKYTNYSVQVQSFTSAGDGPLGLPTYCQTESDLPSKPAGIKINIGGPSSLTVTWLPPMEPNGILTKYTIYIATAETGKGKDAIKRKRQVPPDVNPKFQFDGLRLDEKYELKVSASTKIGEGNHAIAYKILTKTVQSAITSFGKEFRIIWKTDLTLPCETVGNPTTQQWTRYSENVRESDRISGGHEGSLMIRKTSKEDSGNYSCSINDNKGNIVDSIMHRVIVQVPPPVGPLLNAEVNSASSMNLQWRLSDNGGAPIRGYILHMKASDEWLERQISRHLTSYELRDLECGTEYQMYLTAYNKAGMGRASPLVNVSTIGYSPSLSLVAPQFMVETNQTWCRVLLRDVWSENGCPIRKFQVLYKEADASHWQTVPELSGESHSADLLGLKGGTSYTLKVIATNSAGSSQTEVNINTPMAHGVGAEISNTITNYPESLPFYLDIKLMIPIVLTCFAVLIAAGGICLCLRNKTPLDYRSTDHLSMGTSSSSTYFKQNQRNSQQQVYMTVKKSTPKGVLDITDLDPIPQYADDIHPYATFELSENRRDSKGLSSSIPTLDRRRSSNQGHWNPNAMYQDNSLVNIKPKVPRTRVKQEESEEYDSYGSDTDTERDPNPRVNKSSIHPGAICNRLNSKFQDYDSQARHGNRYEFTPPTSGMIRTRQMQNEIHGMVIADPYSFNDAFPTVDERRRKPNRRRSQGHSQFQHHEASEFSGLDPPYDFKDQHVTSQKNNKKSDSSTEYAIAV